MFLFYWGTHLFILINRNLLSIKDITLYLKVVPYNFPLPFVIPNEDAFSGRVLLLKDFIYLLLEGGEGREGERERNTSL